MMLPTTLSPAWRYRLAVALRTVAAVFGGYVIAAAVAALLSTRLPLPRLEAVMAATMLSFVVYAAVILWSFTVGSLTRVCWVLTLAGLLLTGLARQLAVIGSAA